MAENVTAPAVQSPIAIALALSALYRNVGPAICGSVVALLANVIVCRILLKINFGQYQAQRKVMDARLRLTTAGQTPSQFRYCDPIHAHRKSSRMLDSSRCRHTKQYLKSDSNSYAEPN